MDGIPMLSPDDIPDVLSGSKGPLVSVVLATYEPDETIKGAIRSVVNQTYGNIELVVVNGSSDEWLSNLGREIEWVTYKNQSGTGVANAWNEGIDAASGEYISFLADDDYYHKTKTKKQVDALRNSKADIVYSDEYILIQDDGRIVVSGLPIDDPGSHYIEYFRRGQGIPHLTVMGETNSFERHRFDETLQAREDPHLWVRMLKECRPAYVPDPLAYKRRREDSLTGDPEMVYRNELREIADLVEQFPELEEYEAERKRRAKYRYGRGLLKTGRVSEARSTFSKLFRENPTDVRSGALLLASLLPVGTQRAVRLMELGVYWLRQFQ